MCTFPGLESGILIVDRDFHLSEGSTTACDLASQNSPRSHFDAQLFAAPGGEFHVLHQDLSVVGVRSPNRDLAVRQLAECKCPLGVSGHGAQFSPKKEEAIIDTAGRAADDGTANWLGGGPVDHHARDLQAVIDRDFKVLQDLVGTESELFRLTG